MTEAQHGRKVFLPAAKDRVCSSRLGIRHADNLSKTGWSWGCVATVHSNGRTIFVAVTHRDDGKRFVVHADEKLTTFLELEAAVRGAIAMTIG